MHRTFEEIRSLMPSEQRALFESGDPATRLHAAWAIALTIGRDTVPMLRAATIADVPEGLRQQFIVMLAGHGERALLKTIASSDASVAIRATALRYFVRTAASQDAELAGVIAAQLESGDSDIRLALIEEYDADRATLTDEQIIALLADNADAVRVATTAAVLGKVSVADAVRDALARLLLKADQQASSELLVRLGRSEVPRVIRALAYAEPGYAVLVLRALVSHFGPLQWSDIEPASSTEDRSLIIEILRSLRATPGLDALLWVERMYGRAITHEDATMRGTTSGMLLHALLGAPSLELKQATKRTLLDDLDAEIHLLKNWVEDPWEEDYVDDNLEYLQHLGALRGRLRAGA
jgi:hypothetical protein